MGITTAIGFAWRFVRSHAVLCIAAAAAAATMAAVPPDAAYASYFDVDTLICLFCILAVVGALRNVGAFERAARAVTRRFRTPRAAFLAVVLATAALSMVATNDMALIMMLPLSTVMFLRARWARLIPAVFVAQSLAANLCGMIVPFGNPQNLYLYSYFSIGLADFASAMLMPFLLSTALVVASCALLTSPGRLRRLGIACSAGRAACVGAGRRERAGEAGDAGRSVRAGAGVCARDRLPLGARTAVYGCLLAAVVLSVLRVVPSAVSFAAVVAVLAVLDRRALKGVDYALLLTFACFFVFSGNMARIPAVNQALTQLMEMQPLLTAAGLSQVVSNVPAAVLLSHFTAEWQPLLVGVNIGGAGTLVGSLASLITLQHYLLVRRLPSVREDAELGSWLSAGRFLGLFAVFNGAFLAVLLMVGLLVG